MQRVGLFSLQEVTRRPFICATVSLCAWEKLSEDRMD